VIGRGNDLPWRLPADLARFKALTMGHHLIVGRKTFEAIGRPLPGRRMIVLSRGEPALPEGVGHARSLDDALESARGAGDDEVFVGGGGQIYRLALPLADRLYLTHVEAEVDGDAHFPELPQGAWRLVGSEDREPDEKNPFALRFAVYEPA
jgi:dihydrofolate reductase